MKKGVKNLLLLLSSIAFSSALIGCNEKSEVINDNLNEIKFGVSVYEKSDIFISKIVDNLEESLNTIEEESNLEIDLTVLDAGGNQYNQNEQVDEFISQGVDVLCINLVDRRSASYIINKAKSFDIPVIFFNREPVEEDMNMWDKVYYVGAKAEQSGIMQADIVLDIYEEDNRKVDKNGDGKIQYLMLEGEAGHQDTSIRTEYCIKRLKDKGVKVEKLDSDVANWNRELGMEKMENWIKKYKNNIEVVFSNNDAMALGAIDAMKNLNVKNMPIVVGVDGIDEAMEEIKRGNMTGTVLSDSKKQGESIVDIAYELAINGDSKILNRKYTREGHSKVTIENLNEFINK